jgi:hypothetical protein
MESFAYFEFFRVFKIMFFFYDVGILLYIPCVLELRPSAL